MRKSSPTYLREKERGKAVSFTFSLSLSRFFLLFQTFIQIGKQCKKIVPLVGIEPL
jgi:hypothetical protein